MKKGLIFYVTEGKDEVDDWMDLSAERESMQVDYVGFATSENELAYGWWRMLTRGMQQISCMRATYDTGKNRIQAEGHPFRLCG